MGGPPLVSTLPLLLSAGDQLQTFNASQPIWATILVVSVSDNSSWTYLRVESSYVPDPYLVRLPSHRTIKARKLTPWREKPPPTAGKEVKEKAIPVKTDLHSRRGQYSPGAAHFSVRDWDEPKRERWVKNEARPRRTYDDDIGFIPDPWMEKERERKAERRKAKRRRKKARRARKKPSLLPYYHALGCRAGNRLSTIKKRFKKLAFKHHPDRNPGDPESETRFKRINEAFIEISKALIK